MGIKQTWKIYKNKVSVWRNAPGFIGIDLDDGEQIRITDDQIPQLIETMKAVEIIEDKPEVAE
jgi:hypothetical protein